MRLQGVHGWSGLVDADTNGVWVPITGETLEQDWDIMSAFSTPPASFDDLTSSDDQTATLGPDA